MGTSFGSYAAARLEIASLLAPMHGSVKATDFEGMKFVLRRLIDGV
jgi:hypothetical protein